MKVKQIKKREFAPVTLKIIFHSSREMEDLKEALGDVSHSSELYFVLEELLK